MEEKPVVIYLVGEARVGKTSLLNRLNGDPICDNDSGFYDWEQVCLLFLFPESFFLPFHFFVSGNMDRKR